MLGPLSPTVNRCTVGRVKTKPTQKQNQIRMSDVLKARINKYRLKLEKDTGLTVSFSSAVRSLTEKMLDSLGIKA